MAVFALVHGVCVGAFAWDLVVQHLQRAGHTTIAVDLPGDDPTARFSDYADVVVRDLAGADDDVILVGHSTGALTIPIVAARRPVAELIFLCAAIPVPGESVAERGVEWQAIDPAEWQIDNGDGSFSISATGFRRHVAPDADPEVVEETIPLLRPQFLTPFLEKCPIDRMPEVPIRSILCQDDRIVAPEYCRRVARDRLGIEPLELPGDHSPMASRHEELAELLMG